MVNILPALDLKKPDGSILTRIEAEKELWDKCKTSHIMRRLAWGQFGLDGRFAWMLKPTSVTHWILDELIRKRMVVGDPIGVQPELESDDSYFNSFAQRLKIFVEDGRALMPKEGEGIDMSDFQNQSPPNGQQPMPGYAPPAPPPMGGFPGQQAAPPQQYAAPPQPQQYGAPPPAPGFGPPSQQPQFGAPPPAPSFPPQGVQPPVAAPQQQMAAPQVAPPSPAAQAPSNRRRSAKSEATSAPAAMPTPAVQQQMPFGAPPAMPQFGNPGTPAPMAVPQQSAPQSSSVDALVAEVKELSKTVAAQGAIILELARRAKGIDAAVSIMIRPYYEKPLPQQPQQLSTDATFKEIGIPYPS